MKKIIELILGLTAVLAFASCEKAVVVNDATADAFIKTIVNEGDTLFGIAHSVYSFNRISSVSVKSPDGFTFPLPGNTDGGISIFKDPALISGDFTKSLPIPGTYTYTVTFKNREKKDYSNILGSDYLLPPVIDSLKITTDGKAVLLKWSKVENAQFYQIHITQANKEVVAAFLIPQSDDLRVEIPYSSFSPNIPGTFNVELDALLYESSSYSLLQAMSTSYGTLTLP